MKYLALLLLLIIGCKTSSIDSNIKNEFEQDVLTNWKRPKSNREFNFTTDTLIKNLNGKYRNYILGEDTAYIHKYFGTRYTLTSGGCNDSTNWRAKRFGLEYRVQTPTLNGSDNRNCGYIFNVCTDSLGVIGWLDVFTYDCIIEK